MRRWAGACLLSRFRGIPQVAAVVYSQGRSIARWRAETRRRSQECNHNGCSPTPEAACSPLPRVARGPLALAGGARPGSSRTFPETENAVSGRFLQYWDEHCRLAQRGYPISDEMQERSQVDGTSLSEVIVFRVVAEPWLWVADSRRHFA
jgi:hypothetical protein